jgi:tRNA A-37 threonylcarbamoyl transferase component Bud32
VPTIDHRIQKWDHPDILALNPSIASLLPVNKSIIVTYFSTVQVTAQAINRALCANVPEFNSTVGWTGVPVYPISQSSPGRTQPCATLNEATVAMRTPYALGMGVSFTALTSAHLRPASLMINGTVLAPTRESIVQGITNSASPTDLFILAPPGNSDSWPMISTNALAVHSRNSVDCTKAKKLVEFIYWTQTDETAATIAKANKMIVAGQSAPVRRAMLTFVANITCAGELVTDIAYCILNGTICADHGTCFGRTCVCQSGWQGTYCAEPVPEATNSGSTDVLVPLLAACLPFLGILIVLGLILGLFLYWRIRHLKMRDEWEIPYSEVDLGETLGQGGFGSVFRSEWRGTQVAVKVLTDGRINKEIERNFREEVTVMSSLRHPNVVLFMGACTKPPRMFIIMEYMALGSLYELLHNELVPEIPPLLRIKLLYQAAKGMHFLHSSGVAHCDLKSLNLLLDNKWNLKVSDFGLTKVKSELMKNGPRGGAVGTIHWTAPEVLAESESVDYVLADVRTSPCVVSCVVVCCTMHVCGVCVRCV